jgi:hypothetical protein
MTGSDSDPRVLVVTTLRWLSTARLGLALSDAGFAVSAVCPTGHALRGAGFLHRVWRSDPISPLATLREAILSTEPDLIVPCDERAVAQLLSLHASASGEDAVSVGLRAVIERSLGARQCFPILQARGQASDLAAREGVSTAETAVVACRADVARCAAAWGFPLVLKTDGSWGGLGIRIVRDRDEAARAFDDLGRPPSLARAVWRVIKDQDDGGLECWWRRTRPAVTAQRFVPGIPANVAAACWKGRVLATVTVEAIRTAGDRGPATVVRRVESQDMTAAVTTLAHRLELSGFCGFDFMRDESDGRYYLIEINARATPTCHLISPDGVDLPTALRAAVAGESPPAAEKTTVGEIIALFPQEMLRDPESLYLTAACHDLPNRAEFLIHAANGELARRRRLEVLERYVRRMAGLSRATEPSAETNEPGYRPAKAPA